ncbi:MAG TPA: helix-turn-helix transcriptional regulator [Clostridia bacterium]|mgnify:CR=1 FL=1|jgi:PadR family transcriptional regulator PadR|nr:helix-turn-helix transcriptional regulator [Clostridia bacterium]
MNTPNTEILRARVDIFVLNAVSMRDSYGYDILNYIQDRTFGHYQMKQSSVYNILKRLETQGYVQSYEGNESNGGKRRYYAITEQGKEYLSSQKTEWEYARTIIDNLLSDKVFDFEKDIPPFNASDLRPLTPRKSKSDDIEKIAAMSSMVATLSEPVDEQEPVFVTVSDPAAPVALSFDKQNIRFVEEKKPEVAATVTAAPASAPAPAPLPFNKANSDKDIEDESYKALFEEIFAQADKKDQEADVDVTIDCKHINDLRLLLNKEGHRLNTFAPSSNKNYMRYLLTTKLYRDVSILSYLFLVLMLLAVYLAKNSFTANSKALLTVGCVAIVFPIVCHIRYFSNPNKRKKDNVRLNVILPLCLVVYIAFLVLNIIIELLIPQGYSINSPQIYAPSIVALVIPFFGIVFTILYKTNLYHQKVK